jgi:hypothetical protein
MRSNVKRRLTIAASVVGVAIAAIGVAHPPFARSLLMSMGGCPMAGARMTPVESESARRMALSAIPATVSVPAPARPALGFSLDTTSPEDVRAWAKRERVDCKEAREGLIKCPDVRPEALGLPAAQGRIDELSLEFNRQGRLVNTTSYRSHLSPASAAREAHAIVGPLVDKLGPAEKHAGDFDAAQLGASGAASISTAMYRFTDYVADVTAMNTRSNGLAILEHYMSARD